MGKGPAAVALGRRGDLEGKARAAKLTKDEHSEAGSGPHWPAGIQTLDDPKPRSILRRSRFRWGRVCAC